LLDRCWNWLAFALVGEELEEGDEICGAVVSLRSKVDRIQVWTRSKDDVEKINSMGKRLVKLLDVSETDNIGLEFQVRNIYLDNHRLYAGSLTSPCSITVKTVLHRINSSLFKQFLILRSGPHSKLQAWDPVIHQPLAPRVRLLVRHSVDLGLVLVSVVGRVQRSLDSSGFS